MFIKKKNMYTFLGNDNIIVLVEVYVGMNVINKA